MKRRKIGNILLIGILCILLFVTGCQSSAQPNASLQEVYQAVKDAYGDNYAPDVAYTEEQIEEILGIKPELYTEIYAEVPMISARADCFIAAQAADGKADELEQAVEAYRENLVSNSMQYPMNQPLVQSSQVVRTGDYVFFVLLGDIPMEVYETGDDAAILEAAQEQIQIGVDAIKQAVKK